MEQKELQVYANGIVEALISIKDRNRDKLSLDEIDALNGACNLIYHNIKELKTE